MTTPLAAWYAPSCACACVGSLTRRGVQFSTATDHRPIDSVTDLRTKLPRAVSAEMPGRAVGTDLGNFTRYLVVDVQGSNHHYVAMDDADPRSSHPTPADKLLNTGEMYTRHPSIHHALISAMSAVAASDRLANRQQLVPPAVIFSQFEDVAGWTADPSARVFQLPPHFTANWSTMYVCRRR
jgi:hypothetical protein